MVIIKVSTKRLRNNLTNTNDKSTGSYQDNMRMNRSIKVMFSSASPMIMFDDAPR